MYILSICSSHWLMLVLHNDEEEGEEKEEEEEEFPPHPSDADRVIWIHSGNCREVKTLLSKQHVLKVNSEIVLSHCFIDI